MSDSVRLNKYRSLYTGPTRTDKQLQVKAANDRVTLKYIHTPPSLYDPTNIQNTAPMSRAFQVPRFDEPPAPPFMRPTAHNKHIKGSALYNQAVMRQIGELANLIR